MAGLTAAPTAALAEASGSAPGPVPATGPAPAPLPGPAGAPVGARPRRGRRVGAWLVLLLALVVGLSACASGSDEATSQAPVPAADEGAAVGVPDPVDDAGAGADSADGADGAGDDAEGQAAGDAASDGSQPGAGVLTAGGQGRQVVTSGIDVAVEDVEAAARQVRDAALVAGGFVAGESTVGGERPRAEIVLRVPVGTTADVMTQVAGLGEEVSRTAESQDVEATLVDLESRIATQRAGVDRIRALLGEATSLEDVLELEAELTRRQSDLESVRSQQAALADRAALATVTVVLTLPDDVDPQEAAPPFLSGLGSGWDALVASTAVVLVVLGALLPFVVVGLLVTGVVVAALSLRRSARARRGPAPAKGADLPV